ncbi:hypothetical protein NPIL_80461 [Nephila pilipes]|uniref:Uncharacterized protein n=1 Tax=Nephila pilipes TaxID=299642 RepID=A0A8X6R0H4_NEPPI|nr:hypothetical protein NPIL_80461 [Nephila pilipes]
MDGGSDGALDWILVKRSRINVAKVCDLCINSCFFNSFSLACIPDIICSFYEEIGGSECPSMVCEMRLKSAHSPDGAVSADVQWGKSSARTPEVRVRDVTKKAIRK